MNLDREALEIARGIAPVKFYVPGPDRRLHLAVVDRAYGSSDYEVHFPELPGCGAIGHSLKEARVLAREALARHFAPPESESDPD